MKFFFQSSLAMKFEKFQTLKLSTENSAEDSNFGKSFDVYSADVGKRTLRALETLAKVDESQTTKITDVDHPSDDHIKSEDAAELPTGIHVEPESETDQTSLKDVVSQHGDSGMIDTMHVLSDGPMKADSGTVSEITDGPGDEVNDSDAGDLIETSTKLDSTDVLPDTGHMLSSDPNDIITATNYSDIETKLQVEMDENSELSATVTMKPLNESSTPSDTTSASEHHQAIESPLTSEDPDNRGQENYSETPVPGIESMSNESTQLETVQNPITTPVNTQSLHKFENSSSKSNSESEGISKRESVAGNTEFSPTTQMEDSVVGMLLPTQTALNITEGPVTVSGDQTLIEMESPTISSVEQDSTTEIASAGEETELKNVNDVENEMEIATISPDSVSTESGNTNSPISSQIDFNKSTTDSAVENNMTSSSSFEEIILNNHTIFETNSSLSESKDSQIDVPHGIESEVNCSDCNGNRNSSSNFDDENNQQTTEIINTADSTELIEPIINSTDVSPVTIPYSNQSYNTSSSSDAIDTLRTQNATYTETSTASEDSLQRTTTEVRATTVESSSVTADEESMKPQPMNENESESMSLLRHFVAAQTTQIATSISSP